MNTAIRVVIALVIFVMLEVAAVWVSERFKISLGDSAGLAALVGVAVTVAMLWPEGKKGSVSAIDSAYITPNNPSFSIRNELTGFALDANIQNTGQTSESIKSITALIEKGGVRVNECVVVAGARLIAEPTGHVLPCELAPHAHVVVQGHADLGWNMSELAALASDTSTPWEIILAFKFSTSRTRKIRLRGPEFHWP
jgi:hypothetical protein